jgi:hypothetical protein
MISGSLQAFLTELAPLDNLAPYERQPRKQDSMEWQSKAGESPQQTGCSTCTSSPQEAVDEQKQRSTTAYGGMDCFPFLFASFMP